MKYRYGRYGTVKLDKKVVNHLMRDIPQTQIAEHMGTYQPAVSAMFRRGRVKPETLTKLAAALGVREEVLVHPDSIVDDE